ncbi:MULTISPECIES: PH domain-containing protein [Actinoalloteichus]|uniref:Bacterial PH domain n=1 Tax=Actinoalloteichus fjordicus TaxID=1612552 RepID=A0AAC9PRM2_9PSEU|nr:MULTISPECIES: PH domain-containing protein [Actinoalloteichus]APU14524.1 Bacterial PH domain [Actinoalloteichus fjordicus]APU20492.1 Bacterial PH domain [Actinoalloteichus sp. GBA129-24]
MSESISTAESRPILVVRPRRARRVAIGAAAVLIAVFGVVAVLLRDTPTGVYFRLADQIAMAGLGILLGCGALVFARPRLTIDAEGLTVRNFISTRRLEWALVLDVTFPDGTPWARLELPEDEYEAVMAVQAADGQHAVRAMRELRRLYYEYSPHAR